MGWFLLQVYNAAQSTASKIQWPSHIDGEPAQSCRPGARMRKLGFGLIAIMVCVSFAIGFAQTSNQPETVTGTVKMQNGHAVIVTDEGQTLMVDNPEAVKAHQDK